MYAFMVRIKKIYKSKVSLKLYTHKDLKSINLGVILLLPDGLTFVVETKNMIFESWIFC